ncbi:dynein regulatory complex subunit 3 [Amia ocellicauda]|uniref:dynein regulatory complex subunit 3 n=1 Tax=Amia ocellicauda TaxID=2972642 RepID=UPI003463CD81
MKECMTRCVYRRVTSQRLSTVGFANAAGDPVIVNLQLKRCELGEERVVYLRRLKRLHSLSLAGNPIDKDVNYNTFIAAHLPELVYLDFRAVDGDTRELARVQYLFPIAELKLIEAQEQQRQEELQLHKAAYVEFLNDRSLFDSMYDEDTEAAKLANLPGVAQLLESYSSQFVALCRQVFTLGLEQHERREAEASTFFDCVSEAVSDNQERAAQRLNAFEKERREMFSKLHQMTDPKLLEVRPAKCVEELHDSLMTLELQLVNQLEDITKDFERNISDMVSGFTETVQDIFAQCRDLENHHHEKLLEIALGTLAKVAKHELLEDMPDDTLMLLVDKDTVISAVSASHDTHLLKIDQREDELVTRITTWSSTMMEKIQSNEVNRNCKRIAEIHTYIA